jgi:hypothetical protein
MPEQEHEYEPRSKPITDQKQASPPASQNQDGANVLPNPNPNPNSLESATAVGTTSNSEHLEQMEKVNKAENIDSENYSLLQVNSYQRKHRRRGPPPPREPERVRYI